MTLSYDSYAKQVSATLLDREVTEIHLQSIAKVLHDWEEIAPYLDLLHNPHVKDAKLKYPNEPAYQRYIHTCIVNTYSM